MLATLHERFEQVSSDFANLDKKSDKEFDEMQEASEDAREAQNVWTCLRKQ